MSPDKKQPDINEEVGAKNNSEPDTPFQPPEEVAAKDDQAQADESDKNPNSGKKGFKELLDKFWGKPQWPPSKRQTIIIAVVVVLIAGGAVAFALTRHSSPPPHPVTKVAPKPKPKVITSPLTGLPVTAAEAKLPVTGVMIENTLWARPQSGLKSAGVVFEAIAEAGITRFLALYQETSPKNLGPVRSVRPYFAQWCQTFGCSLAHVGGSPEALNDMNVWHVRNLDEFANAGAYHRVSSRAAPHNMYTSMGQLRALEKSHHYLHSQFKSFLRKKDAPSKHPKAASISLSPSSYSYNVHYAYNSKSNNYKRWEGGKPHIDANTGKQISPKVVVALVMPYGLEADGYHSRYGTVGSGPMYVFQDGMVQHGTWHKSSRKAQFAFTGLNKKPIKLNAGQTWITMVSAANQVSYKP